MRYSKNRANVQKDNEKKLEKESLRLHKQLDQETDNHVRLVIEREIYQVNEKLKEVDKVKTDGAIFRSKCQWYENGEKNSNFFLSLEKKQLFKKRYDYIAKKRWHDSYRPQRNFKHAKYIL